MLYKLKQLSLKKIALFFLARILFRFTAMSQNQVIAAANGDGTTSQSLPSVKAGLQPWPDPRE